MTHACFWVSRSARRSSHIWSSAVAMQNSRSSICHFSHFRRFDRRTWARSCSEQGSSSCSSDMCCSSLMCGTTAHVTRASCSLRSRFVVRSWPPSPRASCAPTAHRHCSYQVVCFSLPARSSCSSQLAMNQTFSACGFRQSCSPESVRVSRGHACMPELSHKFLRIDTPPQAG